MSLLRPSIIVTSLAFGFWAISLTRQCLPWSGAMPLRSTLARPMAERCRHQTFRGAVQAWMPYIWVNDLDALRAELKARAAKIIEAPVLRVYKCCEMAVEDNFGFRLCFSMDFQNSNG
jgi:hypothetical protein